MNPEREINKRKEEIKIINKIIEETQIMSQEKEQQYLEEKERLEEEVKGLEEMISEKRKTWVIEGTWRKRVYKHE